MKNQKSTLESIQWVKLTPKSSSLIVGGCKNDVVTEEIEFVVEDNQIA